MDPETSGRSNFPPSAAAARKNSREKNELQVRRKVLLDVIEQCREALASDSDNDDNIVCGKGVKQEDYNRRGSSSQYLEPEIDEFCHMIKNQAGGPELLQKIENIAQASIHLIMSEEGSSWEIVSKDDLSEGENDGLEHKDYVLVRQEDVADGMACFMTTYLLSLKETKDLSPNQLQEALRKTFSIKKRKGKLRKVWDGSQVIYNVASWSATALGIYQNPAVLGAASTAFWTSCQAISKFF
ncbi:hypothetical protein V2J09_000886 [Rumex salicifolius]